MNQDPDSDSQPRKKIFAVPLVKLQEFHPQCLAVANAGSEIFLLLGDKETYGLQKFNIARLINRGKPGCMEEHFEVFDAAWRSPALIRFKEFLDTKTGGYASIGFLSCQDGPSRLGKDPGALIRL